MSNAKCRDSAQSVCCWVWEERLALREAPLKGTVSTAADLESDKGEVVILGEDENEVSNADNDEPPRKKERTTTYEGPMVVYVPLTF